MKKSLFIIAAVASFMLSACTEKKAEMPFLDYDALNQQAAAEYLQPVHPGIRGEVPFWNKYAFKFTYAPAFDFDDVEGAANYVYTAQSGETTMFFTDASPRAALSPIWKELPFGDIKLSVQAVDAENNPVGEAQEREFQKDHPFIGPYEQVDADYMERAVMAAKFIHGSAVAQNWLKSPEPDLSYRFNCYPCKIWSATVQIECFLAQQVPALRDSALTVARTVADCLIRNARPADAPLAYFPPTYYYQQKDDGVGGVTERNQQYTMFVEAVCSAKALLDLYDATKDKKYFEFACNIADSYRRLQAEDGSWPVKVNYITGEPIADAPCMPTTILQLAQRLKEQYKVSGYEDMVAKAEKWLWENTISTFNFNGQFEDVEVGDKAPFQNLTNCTAVDCIDYIMGKKTNTEEEVAACVEMARFTEDQFTVWNTPINHPFSEEPGFEPRYIPFVYEQFEFQTPVDHSTAGVAMAWMRVYKATGDLLALAKAKTLVDSIVKVQSSETGRIPTVMYHDAPEDFNNIWANCTWQSITALMRMDKIVKGK